MCKWHLVRNVLTLITFVVPVLGMRKHGKKKRKTSIAMAAKMANDFE